MKEADWKDLAGPFVSAVLLFFKNPTGVNHAQVIEIIKQAGDKKVEFIETAIRMYKWGECMESELEALKEILSSVETILNDKEKRRLKKILDDKLPDMECG